MYLCQPLFVSMDLCLGKIGEMFIQLLQCLGVVSTEIYLFPQVLGTVRSFDRFEVKVNPTVLFPYGGIFGIGQWT
jgi:hypothetical protein